MPSYPVVLWRSQAITAASARCSTGMRFVLATVPLPTGAWSCDGTGQPVGEINVISMKAQERDIRPEEILDYSAWV
jgi:hypothetical protein